MCFKLSRPHLYQAMLAVKAMRPRPDNLILLVDGLPTQGRAASSKRTVSGKQRLKHFNRAVDELPSGMPVNVIMFPMEGDPMAPAAYWNLARISGGAFLGKRHCDDRSSRERSLWKLQRH